MNHNAHRPASRHERLLSRRSILQQAAAATATTMVAGALTARPVSARAPVAADSALKPLNAISTIVDALRRYPLVGIAELHFLQEWHDLIHALLFHPDLPSALTDIVVEFGNAQYQEIADRFIVAGEQVARPALTGIWRYQGWDAPVYEQFFRAVRAVNWMRPASQRIRVLLGAAPYDISKVRGAADAAFRHWWQNPPDVHYTTVVEREVLAKGRRALLIGGGGHILRGIYADNKVPNVATNLARRYPGHYFAIDTVAARPGTHQVTGLDDATAARLQMSLARWPRPAIAMLAGTWLAGARTWSDRLVSPASAAYAAQADAILYLGPGELLTASQADPEIFQYGSYYQELRRINPIVSQIDKTHEDLIATSLHWAQAGPSWWEQFG